MRKSSLLGRLAKNAKRNATMSATTALYELMWGEKPKRGRKKKDK
jgi:hypothetical protein